MAQEELEEWETEDENENEQEEWEVEVSQQAKTRWEIYCDRKSIDLSSWSKDSFRFNSKDIAYWKEKYLEQHGSVPTESVCLKVTSFEASSLVYYQLMDFLRTTQTKNLELAGVNNDILFALRRLRSLEKIVISDCYSFDETEILGGLAAIFKTNTGIKEFSTPLWGGKDTKAQFLQSIKDLRALEQIEITECNFSGADLLALKQSLEISGAASTLKSLVLRRELGTEFTPASELLQVLTPLVNIEELVLDDLNVPGIDQDLDAYQQFVCAGKSRLSKLSLCDIGISGEMLLSVVSAPGSCLKHLDLNGGENNGFHADTLESHQLLMGLSALEYLSLCNCAVRARHLTLVLRYTVMLEVLEIYDGVFVDVEPDSKEFQEFTQSMQSNKTLRKLHLCCDMTKEMAAPFFKSLNQNLKHLSVWSDGLLVDDIEKSPELHEVFWSNKSLVNLSIDTKEGKCDFPNAVAFRNNLLSKTLSHEPQVNSESWPLLVDYSFGGVSGFSRMWGKPGISLALHSFLVECAHMIPCNPKIYKTEFDAALTAMRKRSRENKKKLRCLEEENRIMREEIKLLLGQEKTPSGH